jgi:H+-transporting ATPase
LFGFLVTPLWWGWAVTVWAYALGWFLITDPMKLAAYRYLDATKKVGPARPEEPKVGHKPAIDKMTAVAPKAAE